MPERKMQIAADNETRRVHYTNQAMIAQSEDEFIINFLFVDHQVQNKQASQAFMTTRVVLNPKNAKRLYQVLGANIRRYEKNFGNIVLPPKLA